MNRFKKELAKRGYKMDKDYPCLPCEVSKNIYLECTIVNSSLAKLCIVYNVAVIHLQFDRAMTAHEII